MSPDRKHFHTLINDFIKRKLKNYYLYKYNNSLTGILINIFLVPNFVLSIIYYNQSLILGLIVLIYVLIYLLIYWFLKNLLNKK